MMYCVSSFSKQIVRVRYSVCGRIKPTKFYFFFRIAFVWRLLLFNLLCHVFPKFLVLPPFLEIYVITLPICILAIECRCCSLDIFVHNFIILSVLPFFGVLTLFNFFTGILIHFFVFGKIVFLIGIVLFNVALVYFDLILYQIKLILLAYFDLMID